MYGQEAKDVEVKLIHLDSLAQGDRMYKFKHRNYYKFHFYSDYEALIQIIQNPESRYFQDSLAQKFKRREIKTPSEKLCLLLAASIHPNKSHPKLEKNYAKIEKLITKKKWEEVKQLAEHNLDLFEYDVRSMGYLFEYYTEMKAETTAKEYFGKVYSILMAVQNSGTFNNTNRPYLVAKKQDIQQYITKYALGANYTYIEEKEDKLGNLIITYKVMGALDHFVVPKSKKQ